MVWGAEGPDPVASWIQLVIQAGALGILILLAYQIPRFILAMREWREATEQAHRQERQEMRDHARESLNTVLAHCEEGNKRRDAGMASLQSELENLQEQIQRLRPDIQSQRWLPHAPPEDKPK